MVSKFTIYGMCLQTLSFSVLMALNGNAQNKSVKDVSVQLETSYGSLDEIFRSIEDQTDYRFAYARNIVSNARSFETRSGERKVYDVLLEISKKRKLKFTRINNSISVERIGLRRGKGPGVVEISQSIKVSGRVTSLEDGEGLPGVNVLVKSTTSGTVTDVDGRYTLECPSKESILIFSFVGFNTEEVLVGDKSEIDIALLTNVTSLEEVVVVGYGTKKRSDLTGSLVSVTNEEFDRQPLTRVDQALQGRAAGVAVTQTSGAPGAGYKIRIRGANSISGSNEPLYVVDGLVVGDILSINVNDIQSLEILKDASATAIYGSRGANGVVLITTKTGRKGTPQVEFQSFFGVSKVIQKLDLMNAADFAQGVNFAEGTDIYTQEEIATLRVNGGEDWQERLFETGSFSNYQLSLTGGSEAVDYYISGNYYNQDGTIISQNYERFGLRVNVNATLSKKMNIGLNTYLSRSERAGVRADLPKGITWDPTTPAFDINGDYNFITQKPGVANGWPNPLIAPENNLNDIYNNQYIINGYFNINLLDNLVLNISGGVERNDSVDNFYKSILVDNTGMARVRNSDVTRYQNTNRLTYNWEKDIHRLQLDAVHEQQYVSTVWSEATATGFFSDNTNYKNLALGAIQRNRNQSVSESLQSFLGRVNYTLLDRYMVTASVRVDGSSKFQGNNRWGYFPSASVAWRLSEEQFLQDVDFISNLKLRTSYGVTGSQAIQPLATRARPIVSPDINYPFAGQDATTGVAPSDRLANPDLTWEQTTQTNVGLDLGLWQSKVTLSVDLYKKNTSDLLLDVALPEFTGPTVVAQNVGEVENKGFDISLGFNVVNSKVFDISSVLSVSRNTNKVISLVTDEPIEMGREYASGIQVNPTRVEVGQPISAFRGYVFQGVYQLGEEAEAAVFGRAPGDAKYLDVNGDNVISTDDIVTIGDGNPDFTWGWNWNVGWRNFELSLLLMGSHGNDIYNLQRGNMMALGAVQFHATHADYNNRWTPENPSNIPSGRDGTELLSSQFLEDGSFVTLKNISLHYTFDSVLPGIGLDMLRLYGSVENPFIITNYSGFDPESTASGNSDVDLGIDHNAYPLSRSFIVGLNLTF